MTTTPCSTQMSYGLAFVACACLFGQACGDSGAGERTMADAKEGPAQKGPPDELDSKVGGAGAAAKGDAGADPPPAVTMDAGPDAAIGTGGAAGHDGAVSGGAGGESGGNGGQDGAVSGGAGGESGGTSGGNPGPGQCPPCLEETPVCDTATGTCRACTQAAGCDGATPHCDARANGGLGACGACLDASHCPAALPACNPRSRVCSDRFAGAWEYIEGTETFACDGELEDGGVEEPDVTDLTGRRLIVQPRSPGVEIDRSLVLDSRACVLAFMVSSETATLSPRTCAERLPLFDITRYMSFVSWHMASADGETMTLAETHTIRLSGDPLTCTSVTEGRLRRVWHEVIAETEPNDDGSVAEAQSDFRTEAADGPLDHDMFVSAAISPSGDEDVFAVRNPSAASAQVRIDTFGPNIGVCGGIDTVITVHDADGAEVASNDDGNGSCSRLTLTLAPSQTVYARVIAYGDRGTIPAYHFGIDFP